MLQKALDAAADALRRQQWEDDKYGEDREEDREGHGDGCGAQNQEDVERSLRVEALGLVAEQALTAGLTGHREGEDEEGTRQGPTPKNLLVVHVDAEVLADPQNHGRSYIEGTGSVSAGTSQRLACDAQVVEVFEDAQGHVLDVGRKRRRVTEPLARALEERDETCQFPGCCRTRHLQVHHLEHWASGGETNLRNLTLLCKYHHGLVHEGGFSVEGTTDGLVFRNPRGEPIAASPPLPGAPNKPADALVIRNRRDGLAISPETNRITWAGEPIEYGWAVEALMPRRRRTLNTA